MYYCLLFSADKSNMQWTLVIMP